MNQVIICFPFIRRGELDTTPTPVQLSRRFLGAVILFIYFLNSQRSKLSNSFCKSFCYAARARLSSNDFSLVDPGVALRMCASDSTSRRSIRFRFFIECGLNKYATGSPGTMSGLLIYLYLLPRGTVSWFNYCNCRRCCLEMWADDGGYDYYWRTFDEFLRTGVDWSTFIICVQTKVDFNCWVHCNEIRRYYCLIGNID